MLFWPVIFPGELAPAVKEKLFLKSFDSLEGALDHALEVQGAAAEVLVLPYGISTLPRLED